MNPLCSFYTLIDEGEGSIEYLVTFTISNNTTLIFVRLTISNFDYLKG